jgi:hypothetical protein
MLEFCIRQYELLQALIDIVDSDHQPAKEFAEQQASNNIELQASYRRFDNTALRTLNKRALVVGSNRVISACSISICRIRNRSATLMTVKRSLGIKFQIHLAEPCLLPATSQVSVPAFSHMP